jgi:hypothetical protein
VTRVLIMARVSTWSTNSSVDVLKVLQESSAKPVNIWLNCRNKVFITNNIHVLVCASRMYVYWCYILMIKLNVLKTIRRWSEFICTLSYITYGPLKHYIIIFMLLCYLVTITANYNWILLKQYLTDVRHQILIVCFLKVPCYWIVIWFYPK